MASDKKIPFDKDLLEEKRRLAIAQIGEVIGEYDEELLKAEVWEEGVPSIYLFEHLWKIMDAKTRNLLVKHVADSIEAIDEHEIIESKKENT